MSRATSVALGASLFTVGVGLIAGSFAENRLTWVTKVGLILVSGLIGAALGRVAFEK